MMMRRLLAVVVGAASLTLPLILAPEDASADNTPTRTEWAHLFLTGLGATPAAENVALVVGWQAAENTTARHNPLATTRRNDGSIGAHNGHGVQHFATVAAGVRASVDTVTAYPSIARALRADDPVAFFAAPGWSRYCSCDPARYLANIRAAYDAAAKSPAPPATPTATAWSMAAAPPPLDTAPSVSSRSGDQGRGRALSPPSVGLLIACGATLTVGTVRGARRQIRPAVIALAASAGAGLAAMNAAGIDLAREMERGADATYGWVRVAPQGGASLLIVCATLAVVLASLSRAQAREVLIRWALTIWRTADLAVAYRAWLYPLAAWAVLVATGVRVGQAWAPWIAATGVATFAWITRGRRRQDVRA